MKPDYKAMYYHSTGQLTTTVDVLETTVNIMRANSDATSALQQASAAAVTALEELTEKIKITMKKTENMFISSEEE